LADVATALPDAKPKERKSRLRLVANQDWG